MGKLFASVRALFYASGFTLLWGWFVVLAMRLDRAAGRANGIAAITPERVIREGDPTDQILDVIDKDVDIAMLVLAANPGPEGPGPIITMMAKTVGSFPIPVTIVPGDLSDEDIDAWS